ncbi:MAG TPA: hypothetical protein VFO38_05405 [Candidatus Saccharimonadales bacterium]|nr:hypothetical protein [Candidatus Saccharimonadales bacterium]
MLSPVYARLQQLGVERGLIHQVCDGWVYTLMFLRGTVHGRTDGTKEFIEDSSSGDSFMFDDASWAVVRHNDSRQIRAIYLWDHAAERDLTELYRLVVEPTR